MARFALGGGLVLGACGGQPAPAGIGEPIQGVGGQFVSGALPKPAGGPSVTAVGLNSAVVIPGAAGKSVSGRVTDSASAVAFRFADLGTGYWVVPVAEPDALYPGEVNFRFSASFDADDPSGFHDLDVVGVDGAGHAGAANVTPLCIAGRIPDNLHSCEPNVRPPSAVITLRWDTNFDLDLHVLTPSGVDVSPKAPLVVPIEAGASPAASAARIDRDSLGGCIPDGLRQEDLVFQSPPDPGTYQIRVDPFASCGQSSARFDLTVYRLTGACPACSLQATFDRAGELLGSQATSGASPALFVAEISF